jgi:hypothetical protein
MRHLTTTEQNTSDFEEGRVFIRHATSVPLQCNEEGHIYHAQELTDISHGGLAFMSHKKHSPGDIVELSFPSIKNHPALRGEVVWSREVPESDYTRYHEGIRFLNEKDHFHARIVEQVCYIESYVAEQKRTGREITPEEAAQEWTSKYAASFPE